MAEETSNTDVVEIIGDVEQNNDTTSQQSPEEYVTF